MSDFNWVESFYTDLENNLTGYKRPDNYLERANKLVSKQRKPVNCGHLSYTWEMSNLSGESHE